MQLRDLEGCRPPGGVDPLEAYLSEKGGDSQTVAAAAGLFFSPAEVESIATGRSEAVERQQGVASYAGELALQLQAAGVTGMPVRLRQLKHTHLTDLFTRRYGVPLDELTQNHPDALALSGSVYGEQSAEGFGLNYATSASGESTFWQIFGDNHGFVNMHCVGPPGPLRGEGNIAFIPGVEEALRRDVGLLIEAVSADE
ncbi:MAG TPA: hypothetical protein VK674_04230 [Candidatus Limnocylindria bacterium]|nr:hypothetical protein [Candidatus Limnocylindria bacterium]